MSCRDSVSAFIERHGISGYLKRFHIAVTTVDSAVRATGSPPSSIVKTLVVKVDGGYAAVIIPGDRKLSLQKVARVLGSESARLARPSEVRDATGFDVGGVSPLSDCVKSLRTVVDPRVVEKDWVWCGGGDPHSLVYVSVRDLVRVLRPVVADVSEG